MGFKYWILALGLTAISAVANTLIENVTLISAERNKPLYNAHVKISGDRIVKVSTKPLKAQKHATVIDGQGKYLMPGLMDAHVHISTMPGILFDESGDKDKRMKRLQQLYLDQQPRSYLYFGVTQLLDPSNSKAAIADFKTKPQRPDLFHCGAVPLLKGYPNVWSSDEVAHKTFDYLLKPDDPYHTPEAVVARMAKDGVNCVKVFIEDGFGNNSDWPLISENQLRRIRAAANKHNLPVFAHANAIDMQQIAVKADVDVMAHGMWNWNQFDGAKGLPDEIKAILDDVIAKGIVYQSTFNVMDGLKGVTVPGVLNDPLYNKVVPKEIMDWYQTEQGHWFAREMVNDYGDVSLAQIHRWQDMTINQGERATAYLYHQSHTMVLASDTPSSPTFAAQPGYSTFTELKHMVKIGISLQDLMAAATLNNAKAYGLDQDYGTVEAGKKANLLLLDKNPLSTVEAYNAIDKVILHGEVIERESLAAN